MKEAAIKQCLKELADALSSYDGGAGKGDSMGIYESGAGDAPVVDDYLAQLRLRVKYLVFDLEATRRENRYLRQMLDVHRRRKQDKDEEKDGRTDW